MAEDRQTQQASEELESFLEWRIPNKPDFERSTIWYVVMFTTAAIVLVYSIITTNFLFAVLVILVAFIVIMNDAKPRTNIKVAITSQGLLLANTMYRYKEFEAFYIIYEPPRIQKLVLERPGIRQEITVDIVDVDPIEVRELLLQVIPENLEAEDEPMGDVLQKFFKF